VQLAKKLLVQLVLNLHHSGLATVLDCLPAAIEGIEVNLKVNFENIEKKFKRINLKDKNAYSQKIF
jgi:hypothetical protein